MPSLHGTCIKPRTLTHGLAQEPLLVAHGETGQGKGGSPMAKAACHYVPGLHKCPFLLYFKSPEPPTSQVRKPGMLRGSRDPASSMEPGARLGPGCLCESGAQPSRAAPSPQCLSAEDKDRSGVDTWTGLVAPRGREAQAEGGMGQVRGGPESQPHCAALPAPAHHQPQTWLYWEPRGPCCTEVTLSLLY